MTHTYVVMELSQAAYDEIAAKMRAAGYDHVFGSDGEIDMHGIAPAPRKLDESIRHGVNCIKARHRGAGELHSPDDDTPYSVDGFLYCGRCHYAL